MRTTTRASVKMLLGPTTKLRILHILTVLRAAYLLKKAEPTRQTGIISNDGKVLPYGLGWFVQESTENLQEIVDSM